MRNFRLRENNDDPSVQRPYSHYHEGTYTGSVYLDGKDTRDLSLFDISLKVGSVFQNPRSQFFNVDTTSELAFGPENHGMAEDIVRERVKRVAAQLKLEPLLDRSIFSLSGVKNKKSPADRQQLPPRMFMCWMNHHPTLTHTLSLIFGSFSLL